MLDLTRQILASQRSVVTVRSRLNSPLYRRTRTSRTSSASSSTASSTSSNFNGNSEVLNIPFPSRSLSREDDLFEESVPLQHNHSTSTPYSNSPTRSEYVSTGSFHSVSTINRTMYVEESNSQVENEVVKTNMFSSVKSSCSTFETSGETSPAILSPVLSPTTSKLNNTYSSNAISNKHNSQLTFDGVLQVTSVISNTLSGLNKAEDMELTCIVRKAQTQLKIMEEVVKELGRDQTMKNALLRKFQSDFRRVQDEKDQIMLQLHRMKHDSSHYASKTDIFQLFQALQHFTEQSANVHHRILNKLTEVSYLPTDPSSTSNENYLILYRTIEQNQSQVMRLISELNYNTQSTNHTASSMSSPSMSNPQNAPTYASNSSNMTDKSKQYSNFIVSGNGAPFYKRIFDSNLLWKAACLFLVGFCIYTQVSINQSHSKVSNHVDAISNSKVDAEYITKQDMQQLVKGIVLQIPTPAELSAMYEDKLNSNLQKYVKEQNDRTLSFDSLNVILKEFEHKINKQQSQNTNYEILQSQMNTIADTIHVMNDRIVSDMNKFTEKLDEAREILSAPATTTQLLEAEISGDTQMSATSSDNAVVSLNNKVEASSNDKEASEIAAHTVVNAESKPLVDNEHPVESKVNKDLVKSSKDLIVVSKDNDSLNQILSHVTASAVYEINKANIEAEMNNETITDDNVASGSLNIDDVNNNGNSVPITSEVQANVNAIAEQTTDPATTVSSEIVVVLDTVAEVVVVVEPTIAIDSNSNLNQVYVSTPVSASNENVEKLSFNDHVNSIQIVAEDPALNMLEEPVIPFSSSKTVEKPNEIVELYCNNSKTPSFETTTKLNPIPFTVEYFASFSNLSVVHINDEFETEIVSNFHAVKCIGLCFALWVGFMSFLSLKWINMKLSSYLLIIITICSIVIFFNSFYEVQIDRKTSFVTDFLTCSHQKVVVHGADISIADLSTYADDNALFHNVEENSIITKAGDGIAVVIVDSTNQLLAVPIADEIQFNSTIVDDSSVMTTNVTMFSNSEGDDLNNITVEQDSLNSTARTGEVIETIQTDFVPSVLDVPNHSVLNSKDNGTATNVLKQLTPILNSIDNEVSDADVFNVLPLPVVAIKEEFNNIAFNHSAFQCILSQQPNTLMTVDSIENEIVESIVTVKEVFFDNTTMRGILDFNFTASQCLLPEQPDTLPNADSIESDIVDESVVLVNEVIFNNTTMCGILDFSVEMESCENTAMRYLITDNIVQVTDNSQVNTTTTSFALLRADQDVNLTMCALSDIFALAQIANEQNLICEFVAKLNFKEPIVTTSIGNDTLFNIDAGTTNSLLLSEQNVNKAHQLPSTVKNTLLHATFNNLTMCSTEQSESRGPLDISRTDSVFFVVALELDATNVNSIQTNREVAFDNTTICHVNEILTTGSLKYCPVEVPANDVTQILDSLNQIENYGSDIIATRNTTMESKLLPSANLTLKVTKNSTTDIAKISPIDGLSSGYSSNLTNQVTDIVQNDLLFLTSSTESSQDESIEVNNTFVEEKNETINMDAIQAAATNSTNAAVIEPVLPTTSPMSLNNFTARFLQIVNTPTNETGVTVNQSEAIELPVANPVEQDKLSPTSAIVYSNSSVLTVQNQSSANFTIEHELEQLNNVSISSTVTEPVEALHQFMSNWVDLVFVLSQPVEFKHENISSDANVPTSIQEQTNMTDVILVEINSTSLFSVESVVRKNASRNELSTAAEATCPVAEDFFRYLNDNGVHSENTAIASANTTTLAIQSEIVSLINDSSKHAKTTINIMPISLYQHEFLRLVTMYLDDNAAEKTGKVSEVIANVLEVNLTANSFNAGSEVVEETQRVQSKPLALLSMTPVLHHFTRILKERKQREENETLQSELSNAIVKIIFNEDKHATKMDEMDEIASEVVKNNSNTTNLLKNSSSSAIAPVNSIHREFITLVQYDPSTTSIPALSIIDTTNLIKNTSTTTVQYHQTETSLAVEYTKEVIIQDKFNNNTNAFPALDSVVSDTEVHSVELLTSSKSAINDIVIRQNPQVKSKLDLLALALQSLLEDILSRKFLF